MKTKSYFNKILEETKWLEQYLSEQFPNGIPTHIKGRIGVIKDNATKGREQVLKDAKHAL